MQIKYYNNQNIFQKYKELEKNYLKLKRQVEGNNQEQNYKTELCKKFQSKGYCPYGSKCRFAHGKEELVSKFQGSNYKKEKCKTFFEKGYCPYGSRCQFQHDERKFKDINISFLYLRLFILKYFGFDKSRLNNYYKISKLCNKRLTVFESLTNNDKDTKTITINNVYNKKYNNINDINLENYSSNNPNNSSNVLISFNNNISLKDDNIITNIIFGEN